MFRIRRPTVRSWLFVVLVLGITIRMTYYGGFFEETLWAIALWSLPILLAHWVETKKRLFATCAVFDFGWGAVAKLIVLVFDHDALDNRDIVSCAYDAAVAGYMPSLIFPFTGIWGEAILRSAFSAPFYGLVGVVYASCCAEVSPPTAHRASPSWFSKWRARWMRLNRTTRYALILLLIAPCAWLYYQRAEAARRSDQLHQAGFFLDGPDQPYWHRTLFGYDPCYVARQCSVSYETTDDDLRLLRYLPRLDALELQDAPITDIGLLQVRAATNLKYLTLSRTRVTDRGLAHLSGLAELRRLDLNETSITGAGLAHLRGLSRLTALDVSDSQISDADTIHLGALIQLRELDLRGTAITDAGLVAIAGLEHLASLDVSGTRITDAGLTRLAGLSELRELNLNGAAVTDSGLARLTSLTQLEKLRLSGTQITDAGVSHLHRFHRLNELYLNETAITDDGLRHLSALAQLDCVELYKTQVTDAGALDLQESLPNLNVRR